LPPFDAAEVRAALGAAAAVARAHRAAAAEASRLVRYPLPPPPPPPPPPPAAASPAALAAELAARRTVVAARVAHAAAADTAAAVAEAARGTFAASRVPLRAPPPPSAPPPPLRAIAVAAAGPGARPAPPPFGSFGPRFPADKAADAEERALLPHAPTALAPALAPRPAPGLSRVFWGVACITSVAAIWVGAGELAQFLFTTLSFSEPIFLTYVNVSEFAVLLPLAAAARALARP
jgi:hypothetical protein